MLLSMTGYGEARWQNETLSISVELRAVNNRYLKINLRCPDVYHLLEAQVERTVREKIRRGTLSVQLQINRQVRADDFPINFMVVRAYLDQLGPMLEEMRGRVHVDLAQLLQLPGVLNEPVPGGNNPLEEWPLIEPVLKQALHGLQAMRQEEGRAMALELRQYVDQVQNELEQVKQRVPNVVRAYRDRLHERISQLLEERQLTLDEASLVKEVALFAERSDISEEVVRLGSHLGQFKEMLNDDESPGRKLDFLIQEMNREVNTMGSKGNDLEIARLVVEMKSIMEKMRELVQNVE